MHHHSGWRIAASFCFRHCKSPACYLIAKLLEREKCFLRCAVLDCKFCHHSKSYFEAAARAGANEKEARRLPTESTNSPGSIVGFRPAPMNDRSSGVIVKERLRLSPGPNRTFPNRTSRRPGG